MANGVGTEKICPLAQVLTEETRMVSHCRDDCEWNDGEGCAIWRIVKALEKIATAQAPMARQ